MSNALAERPNGTAPADAIEIALVTGDLSKLTSEQRVTYYHRTCQSLGLNPLTKPFDYLSLNGKLQLYARKDCTEQLRNKRDISVKIAAREVSEGCYVVTAQARMPNGRTDESVGAVPIDGLKGEARANAMMKAETKAKRRVTLSICGLGILDESEIESIPNARAIPTEAAHDGPPATIENRPAEPPADPKPHAAAMRRELLSGIKELAKLRDISVVDASEKVLAFANDRLKVQHVSLSDLNDRELHWTCDTVQNWLAEARKKAQEKSEQPQPAPEREPGDDPPDEETHDHGDPVAAGPAQVRRKLADQTFAVLQECGVNWPEVIAHSAKSGKHNFLGRTLARDAKVMDLSLEEHSRVQEWCRKEKARKDAMTKQTAGAA